MDFSTELYASLREFAATGTVEVHENGGRVASLSGMSWEVRGFAEKPLPHLWSEHFEPHAARSGDHRPFERPAGARC